jgi:hypothetical protein
MQGEWDIETDEDEMSDAELEEDSARRDESLTGRAPTRSPSRSATIQDILNGEPLWRLVHLN